MPKKMGKGRVSFIFYAFVTLSLHLSYLFFLSSNYFYNTLNLANKIVEVSGLYF